QTNTPKCANAKLSAFSSFLNPIASLQRALYLV
ncbi:MAG: hypothetical protein ACI96M_004772, partial [Candidatus Azotimanducaceae bacterium]